VLFVVNGSKLSLVPTLAILNSYLSGNRAFGTSCGGALAVYVTGGGNRVPLSIQNTTFVGNIAGNTSQSFAKPNEGGGAICVNSLGVSDVNLSMAHNSVLSNR
jgi:hypothetical protein